MIQVASGVKKKKICARDNSAVIKSIAVASTRLSSVSYYISHLYIGYIYIDILFLL